jgi:hypothetical protein
MRVVILGAGVIGVSTAYYLAKAGHEVCVIDRQPEAGLETSFANGGQISASHAEPWANPRAPLQFLKWFGRTGAPVKFPLRLDPAQWGWSLSFLRNCLPGRTRRNTEKILKLALYSRAALNALIEETGIARPARQRPSRPWAVSAKSSTRPVASRWSPPSPPRKAAWPAPSTAPMTPAAMPINSPRAWPGFAHPWASSSITAPKSTGS